MNAGTVVNQQFVAVNQRLKSLDTHFEWSFNGEVIVIGISYLINQWIYLFLSPRGLTVVDTMNLIRLMSFYDDFYRWNTLTIFFLSCYWHYLIYWRFWRLPQLPMVTLTPTGYIGNYWNINVVKVFLLVNIVIRIHWSDQNKHISHKTCKFTYIWSPSGCIGQSGLLVIVHTINLTHVISFYVTTEISYTLINVTKIYDFLLIYI